MYKLMICELRTIALKLTKKVELGYCKFESCRVGFFGRLLLR